MKLSGIQGIVLKCCKVAAKSTLLTEPGKDYKYKFRVLARSALFAASSSQENMQRFRKQIQMW